MKSKLISTYQAHGKFYAFVNGLEGATVASLVSWQGGLPATHTAWISFAAFLGRGLWGFIKAYLQANKLPTS